MPVAGMVHRERYDADAARAAVADYDAALKAHYDAIGKTTTEASWSDEIDKKFAARPRDRLRAQLAARGFDFR